MCRTAEAKKRFLGCYADLREVAPAARQAGIHRATVYRWRADAAFVQAMNAAWESGYERWRREVYEPGEREREAARARRDAELRPMRQEHARQMGAARRRR